MKVLDHSPGKVVDWEMTFSAPIIDYVEPAMASASPKQGCEIHGVAYATSKEDCAKIDKMEDVGNTHVVNHVTIDLYDGRQVRGQVYTAKNPIPPSKPSVRYVNVLVKGATDVGLDAAYI